jgi:hypothetical protein
MKAMSSVKTTRKNLSAIVTQTQATGNRVNSEAAQFGAEMARALCPVSSNNKPGHTHLRDTIGVEVDEQTGAASIVAGDESRGVTLAEVLAVEFGTMHEAAHGFIRAGTAMAEAEAKKLAAQYKPRS